MGDTDPADVVKRFLDAIAVRDYARASALMADDFVYDSLPVGQFYGPDAERMLGDFLADARRISFDVTREYTAGDTVIQERVDRYEFDDGAREAPVASFFQVRGGKLRSWRLYFDVASLTAVAR